MMLPFVTTTETQEKQDGWVELDNGCVCCTRERVAHTNDRKTDEMEKKKNEFVGQTRSEEVKEAKKKKKKKRKRSITFYWKRPD